MNVLARSSIYGLSSLRSNFGSKGPVNNQTEKIQKKLFQISQRNSSLWTKYSQSLETHPLVVKGLTSGVLSFGADLICQVYFPAEKETNENMNEEVSIDWNRTVKFTAIGTFYTAPVLHYWYGTLSRFIPGNHLKATIIR